MMLEPRFTVAVTGMNAQPENPGPGLAVARCLREAYGPRVRIVGLSYDALDGVQDGGMAMEAFLEALHPGVSPERKAAIEQQLLAYCQLDTYAMVRLWQVFAGRTDLEL